MNNIKEYYTEPERQVPVLADFDVVVCGGGPAGCAAATAAARQGALTLLIERDGYLGGTTVTSLVCVVLSTNGVDFQGVWHDWARALQKRGGWSGLARNRHPLGPHWLAGTVDPELVKYAWDDVVSEAGVKLLHHVWFGGVMKEAGCVTGVLVETKAGRRAIRAKRVVDCTGDADVCAAAGAEFDIGLEGKPWAMGVGYMWRLLAGEAIDTVEPGQIVPGAGRRLGQSGMCIGGMLRVLKVDPLDPWALSEATRDGRTEVWNKLKPGQRLVDTAARPGVRSSRRVRGLERATDADSWELRKHSDTIARASWEIDIHSAELPHALGVKFDDPAYRERFEATKKGDWFDIRYGSLVPKGVDNILVAGRCISADHFAQASLRIQQTCMATGQAAGMAAALSIAENTSPRELDVMKLVNQLERDRAATRSAI